MANLTNIVTIPKARLVRRIGALGPAKLTAVRDAIVFALALDVEKLSAKTRF